MLHIFTELSLESTHVVKYGVLFLLHDSEKGKSVCGLSFMEEYVACVCSCE